MRLLPAAAWLILLACALHAQVEVTGRVIDENGAAVAGARLELRTAAGAEAEVVVTDTVALPPDMSHDLIKVVSVDRILADTIQNVFCDESVSEIFAGQNQLF